jgi:hypothetical protein
VIHFGPISLSSVTRQRLPSGRDYIVELNQYNERDTHINIEYEPIDEKLADKRGRERHQRNGEEKAWMDTTGGIKIDEVECLKQITLTCDLL